jgi:hypothetical protein
MGGAMAGRSRLVLASPVQLRLTKPLPAAGGKSALNELFGRQRLSQKFGADLSHLEGPKGVRSGDAGGSLHAPPLSVCTFCLSPLFVWLPPQ